MAATPKMDDTSISRFSIDTYESPRNPTSYTEPFAGGTASRFALNEKNSATTEGNGGVVQSPTTLSVEPDHEYCNLLLEQTQQKSDNATATATADAKVSKEIPNPMEEHPELELSGRLISASICIRHVLGFDRSRAWDLSLRRGTSALFDHFTHLSSPQSPWKHTLVAWTGEIESTGNASKVVSLPRQPETAKARPSLINPSSEPVSLRSSIRASAGAKRGVMLDCKDREALEAKLWNEQAVRTLPVWLFDESEDGRDSIVFTDQSRWRRYAEHELYPALHYRLNPPTDGSQERKWWADYVRMNEKFADRIMEVYQPGDVVWVHDYQLMLLPAILRQRNAKMYIGLFLHAPFPSSELFRCIKNRRELLKGALGANLVGFQTYSYARHFSSCCARILDFDALPSGVDAYGAHIAVDYHPIGVDAKLIEREIFEDVGVEAAVKRIRDQYEGVKIILGRDRLDTGRGVIQKLQAYELFLERYPEWQGNVVLVQLTNLTSVDEGKEDTESAVIKKVSSQIADINEIYGDAKWTPILHFPQHLERSEYYALLQMANVGLVTSVRDGMNTTAMEFIIAQKDNHSPLILSEFSGTASKLKDAILVNPWDLANVADEIRGALVQPEADKAARHCKLYDCVTSETVMAWSDIYLKTLMVNLASFNQKFISQPLSKVDLLLQYRKSRQRLFMFDYDGTLTPTAKEPDAAIPSDRVIRTIKKLAQDPRNSVWVISGRTQGFLNEWMGHIPELGLSAEHGSFIRWPETEEWTNLAAEMDMSWQEKAMAVVSSFAERTQGSYVEKKENAISWHYRRADPDLGKYQAHECRRVLEADVAKHYDIEVLGGRSSLEVRPRFVNKGEIARRFIDAFREGHQQCQGRKDQRDAGSNRGGAGPDFVMCLGDDFSDEEMFGTVNDSGLPPETMFTCVVGASTKETLARWHLLEPADVIATIAFLNGRPSASDAAAVEEVEARLRAEQSSAKA